MNIDEAWEKGRSEGLDEAWELLDEFASITRMKYHNIHNPNDKESNTYKIRMNTIETIKILLEERMSK